MLANQIRPITLSAAIVFRVHPFLAKKHRELPFLAIALFFYTWVGFAREGKAVALQYHEQGSTDTNVCGGFAVVRALSVDALGVRGAQERALLVPDDNIGT